MKLIALVFLVIGWILNLLYTILMLPYAVYIHYKNKRWRKNPQVGDECFYKNLLGSKTHCVIHEINEGKLWIKSDIASQWTTVKDLRKY